LERVGSARLWLVEGSVPHFREMVELGREIVRALVEVLGPAETVRRFSDPCWLTALACVLGFEWNTSGQTTVTLKALKVGLQDRDIPVRIVGGKGEEMRWVPYEAGRQLRKIGVEDAGELISASRLTCSVDESAIQDSYRIYFHTMIVAEGGTWVVVNQGMNVDDRTARRYHWSSEKGAGVQEPHTSILAERERECVLDLTSPFSSQTRKVMVEILGDTPPSRIKEDLAQVKAILKSQRLLDKDIPPELARSVPSYLAPPTTLDEETLRRVKSVGEFKELLVARGIGPATIRGLAYISCLIYGSKASWRDPVKFAYAHGTKSGRPYYVDRRAMLEHARILRDAVLQARLGDHEKIQAIRRLSALVSDQVPG
jgi:hypothetical protein